MQTWLSLSVSPIRVSGRRRHTHSIPTTSHVHQPPSQSSQLPMCAHTSNTHTLRVRARNPPYLVFSCEESDSALSILFYRHRHRVDIDNAAQLQARYASQQQPANAFGTALRDVTSNRLSSAPHFNSRHSRDFIYFYFYLFKNSATTTLQVSVSVVSSARCKLNRNVLLLVRVVSDSNSLELTKQTI